MPTTRRVLSIDLACTDYEALGAHLLARCRQPAPYAVDFSNTHIVTMRRHEPTFAATTAHFDLFIPDGMPLIWCLNRQGAALRDRVYGPTFMRKFLASCPAEFSHYFLGGSPECGKKLQAQNQRDGQPVSLSPSAFGLKNTSAAATTLKNPNSDPCMRHSKSACCMNNPISNACSICTSRQKSNSAKNVCQILVADLFLSPFHI